MTENTNPKYEIFATKEDYLKMRKDWANYFNNEARKLDRNEYGNKILKLTESHFAMYALLRGKDPAKCFGGDESRAEYAFSTWIDLTPFGDIVTKGMLEKAILLYKAQQRAA